MSNKRGYPPSLFDDDEATIATTKFHFWDDNVYKDEKVQANETIHEGLLFRKKKVILLDPFELKHFNLQQNLFFVSKVSVSARFYWPLSIIFIYIGLERDERSRISMSKPFSRSNRGITPSRKEYWARIPIHKEWQIL